MSEKCDRCGQVDEDRRTLHMACFYAMEELKPIPFKEEVVFTADLKDLVDGSEKPVVFDGITLSGGTVRCTGELHPRGQYTLRVCKDCRAEWMSFIQAWYACRGDSKRKSTGTGVYTRQNGANVELTEEEVEEFRKQTGREPARVKEAGEDGGKRKGRKNSGRNEVWNDYGSAG